MHAERILVGAVGLLVGIGIGWGVSSRRDSGVGSVRGAGPIGRQGSEGRAGVVAEGAMSAFRRGVGTGVHGAAGFEAALRAVLNAGNRERWHVDLVRLLGDATLAEVQQAMQLLTLAATGEYRDGLNQVVLDRWTELDPRGAFEHVLGKTSSDGTQAYQVGSVLRRWMDLDDAAAMSAWESLPEGKPKEAALIHLLGPLSDQDPERAKALIRDAPNETRRQELAGAYLTRLAQRDPAAAAAALERGDFKASPHVAGVIASEWARQDPDAAWAWLLKRKPSGGSHGYLGDGYHAVLRAVAGTDRNKALRMARDIPGTMARQQAVSSLLQEWAQVDLGAAVAAMKAIEDPGERRKASTAMAWAWAEKDREGAMKYALELPPGQERSQYLGQVARQWAGSEPKAALAWAQSLPTGPGRVDALSAVFDVWAASDAKAVAEVVQGLPPGRELEAGLRSVSQALAQQDIREALSWLREHGTPSSRGIIAQSLIWNMPLGDQESARLLIDMVPPAQRTLVEGSLLNRLAEHDMDGAVAWLRQMPAGQSRDQALNQFVWRWAQERPGEAADFAAGMAPGQSRENALRNVSSQWATQDAGAALKWASNLDDPLLRRQALAGVLSSWSGQAPSEAAEYVARLPGGREQTELALQVASAWAGQDPRSALDWVRAFGDEGLRQQGLNSVLSSWAHSDSESAGQWVRSLPAGSERATVATALARNLAWNDPAAAAGWTEFVGTEHAEYGSLTASIAGAWANQDPAKASDWLKTLPAGEGRDSAVQSFVNNAARNEPRLAADWALTLGGPHQSQAVLQGVLHQWIREDAAQAKAWFDAARLPEEMRANLLRAWPRE